jgi:hypothetical protein
MQRWSSGMLEPFVSTSDYRIFRISQNGKIVKMPIILEGVTEQQARARALEVSRFCSVELWRGGSRIALPAKIDAQIMVAPER